MSTMGVWMRAHLLNIDAVTRAAEDKTCTHSLSETPGLLADLLLVLFGKVDKMIVFRTDQKWDGSFVEASALPVPLFDTV